MTTTPTACRDNGMKYIVEKDATLKGTWDESALNTALDTPKITQKKYDFADTEVRKTYTNKFYIQTIKGTKITTAGKFFEFKLYVQDPRCDSPTTVTAPSTITYSLNMKVGASADITQVFDAWTV